MDSKERTRQAILDAFSDVSYPGDEAIALHPTSRAGEHACRTLRGHHWRDMIHTISGEHYAAPFFLSPEAKRFYLPAHLLSTLDRLQETHIYHVVLYELDPPEHMARFKREFDMYTPEQRSAIRLFLEYVRDEAGDHQAMKLARTALERYWRSEGEAPVEGGPSILITEPTHKVHAEQAIRLAFADVPYPGDEAIGYDEEDWEDINLDFKGYHWHELPRGVLAYHCRDLPFFSAKGRQFYLPAYLLASLEDFHEIVDPVIYHLTPDAGGDMGWFRRQFDFYTDAQKHAISLFLAYVGTEMPYADLWYFSRIALDRYWAPGEQGPLKLQRAGKTDLAAKERMRQVILQAFADLSYPGDEAIASPSPTSPEESQKVAQDFRGLHFRDVPIEVFLRHQRDFWAFSKEGLRFYFPAYLLAALDDIHDLVYWVIYHLDPKDRSIAGLDAEFAPYTPAQKRAIRLFLEHVRDAMPQVSLADLAQRALDMYWAAAAPSALAM